MAKFPHSPMPEHGLPRDEVMQRLIAMKQDDQDWRGGRVFSLVYSAGDDVHELLSDALALYSAENGLNVLAFPSIGIMQHDIVRNIASLLGADDPASGGAVEGYLTSGAPRACSRRSRPPVTSGAPAASPDRRRGGRECARRVHQGGRLLRRRPRACPGRRGLPRQRRSLADACTDETIMVVGSAPTYPHGVIDPIADIAALAHERGILCHVDACMGGFLLPS